jgi:pyruvate dehydrogenase E2 component (dihydrolipoamide acetyltransferase)
VRGSGRGGRIVVEDVRDYIAELQRRAETGGAAPAAAEPARASGPSVDFAKWGPVSREPLSPLRRAISRQMSDSFSIPHVTLFDEADIGALLALRAKHQPRYAAEGARLSLTPFLLKAVIPALQKFPVLNASLDEAAQELVHKRYYHIGVAVDIAGGLIVPVVKDVDRKSLLELSRELDVLAAQARERSIAPEHLKGGTFTISNQGALGGGHFTPIINRPELAILGVGRGVAKPVIVDGEIVPRTLLPLSLTFDHRVADGAEALRFLQEIVRALEQVDEDGLRI